MFSTKQSSIVSLGNNTACSALFSLTVIDLSLTCSCRLSSATDRLSGTSHSSSGSNELLCGGLSQCARSRRGWVRKVWHRDKVRLRLQTALCFAPNPCLHLYNDIMKVYPSIVCLKLRGILLPSACSGTLLENPLQMAESLRDTHAVLTVMYTCGKHFCYLVLN